MCRRFLAAGYVAAAILVIEVGSATAQNAIKIGVVIPMTGAFAPVGREVAAGAKLYIQQHGDTVAGQKIELIIRDDAGVPDNGKRLTQELIVKERVSFLGAGITPTAMAMAPLVTEGKIATVVMISGTSVVTERSPYYVRTSFTLGQQSGIMADWAIQNSSKKAVCILSDWAPGTEAGKVFEQHFTKGGGQVLDTLRVPLANPDFAPFLQRARDLQPDTLFVFVPAGQAGTLARQYAERGLAKSGIRLVAPGDIVDDDDLPGTGDTFLGVVTAGFYSAAHASQTNKEFRPFLAFWHEALPGVTPKQRRHAVEIVMMTLEAAGKRVSEDRKSFADVDAYAQALGDMVCAYVAQLRRGSRIRSQ
jgi:branched-chain amino acid transport system substrate-binding protein